MEGLGDEPNPSSSNEHFASAARALVCAKGRAAKLATDTSAPPVHERALLHPVSKKEDDAARRASICSFESRQDKKRLQYEAVKAREEVCIFLPLCVCSCVRVRPDHLLACARHSRCVKT